MIVERLTEKSLASELAAFDQFSLYAHWTIQQWENALESKHEWVFMSDEKQGVAVFQYIPGDEQCELLKVIVSPEFRRQGVASKMIKACIVELGLSRCRLEVGAQNYGAIAAYIKLGFEELHRRPNVYNNGEAALVMMANLKD